MSRRAVLFLSFLGILTTGHESWAAPPVGAHLLDGRTFYGREKVKGGEVRNETYIFKDGTFEARWWGLTGRKPGPYTARTEGDAILFTAETSSTVPGNGTAHWQGKVVGNHIEVTGVIPWAGHPSVEVSGQADLGDPVREALRFEEWLSKLPPKGSPEYEQIEQLAHQKRTVADIRNLGTELVYWLDDQGPWPKIAKTRLGKVVSLQSCPVATAERLRQILVPKYAPDVPATDGWGHPIEMRLDLTDHPGRQHVMCLRSPGRDGKFSGDSYKIESFPQDDMDQDIVWCDGWFVRWPEKAQKPAGQASPH